MAQRMIRILTTRRQRELAPVALDLAKKLAQDVSSGSNRLGLSDGPANNVIGNLAHIRGEFDKILPGEQGDKKIEIDTKACEVFKNAIRLWAAATLKKDHALQLAIAESGKSSSTSQAEKDMQALSDAVNKQLSLPFEPILEVETVADADEDEGDDERPGGKKWNREHKKADAKK